MIVRTIAFRVVRRRRDGLLMAVDIVVVVEPLDLGGDLTGTELALAAPFVEESEEHAVWAELVLFAECLGLLVVVLHMGLEGTYPEAGEFGVGHTHVDYFLSV